MLLIAGTVFGYYLWSLRHEELEEPGAAAPRAASRAGSPGGEAL